MGRERLIRLTNPEETLRFGAQIAMEIAPDCKILALKGELGAGKTTFVQGVLQGLKIQDTAQSPTFTYLQIYHGEYPVYHFDLYRLMKEQDFVLLGFEEYLYGCGLTVIEWPERIASLIPSNAPLIEISYDTPEGRMAEITTWGKR